MKKLFILPVIAATFCVSSSAWAMERTLKSQASTSNFSKESLDATFSQAYPQTMKGSTVPGSDPFHHPELLSFLRNAVRQHDVAPETPETIKILTDYYGPILTHYMTSLQQYAKDNGKDSSEFMRLWTQINTENTDLLSGSPLFPASSISLDVAAARCCHLASSLVESPDPVAESIFSHNNFSSEWISLLDACGAPTPPFFGQTPHLPAWQHSILACIINDRYLKDGTLPGHQRYKYKIIPYVGYAELNRESQRTPFYSNDSIRDRISVHQASFWPNSIYTPLLMEGAFGLTHMVEALLQNIICVPLTLKQASVHTVKFSPHQMAIHDLLHSDLDPRDDALYQEILNRLADFSHAGGYVMEAVQPAVELVEKRCKKLHDILLECVNTQKERFLSADSSEQAVGGSARKHYNTVISGLALIFHELYTFSADTLKALTFEEAMDSLKLKTSFGPLFEADLNDNLSVETPQHVWSASSDEDILKAVKTKFMPAGEWTVSRYPLAIDIEANHRITGEKITHSITTLRGLRTTYEDLNGYLKPSGNNVEVPNLEGLSYPDQLTVMLSFAEHVRANTRVLIDDCIGIVKGNVNMASYNSFVAEQEASWNGLKQTIVVPEESVENTPHLPIGARTSSTSDDKGL